MLDRVLDVRRWPAPLLFLCSLVMADGFVTRVHDAAAGSTGAALLAPTWFALAVWYAHAAITRGDR